MYYDVYVSTKTLISLRISDDLLRWVDERARKQGRNRSQMVCWILRHVADGGVRSVGIVEDEEVLAGGAVSCPQHGSQCGAKLEGGAVCCGITGVVYHLMEE